MMILKFSQNAKVKRVLIRRRPVLPAADDYFQIRKISLCKMSYFPEPYTRSKNKIKVELGLPNYATKFD